MLILLKLLLSISFANTNNTKLIMGKVYDRENQLVYTEQHTEKYSNEGKLLSINTVYYDPSKKPFAKLNSDFVKNPYAPDYKYEDERMSRYDGIKSIKGKDTIIAFAKPNKDKDLKEKEFRISEDLVSGQGLYSYVYANFDKLLNMKKSIYVDFLVPMQQEKYAFILEQSSKTEEQVVYKIKFRNWLVRLFAPFILVTYDIKTKMLLEYQGPSNVPGKEGEVQNVVIKYERADLK